MWLCPGANKSVVAHLTADGAPTLSTYRNDVSDSEAGARVTVRHDAAVGPVNVYANGDKVISRLANPDQAVLDIPATTLRHQGQGGRWPDGVRRRCRVRRRHEHDHLRNAGFGRELQPAAPGASHGLTAVTHAITGSAAQRPAPSRGPIVLA